MPSNTCPNCGAIRMYPEGARTYRVSCRKCAAPFDVVSGEPTPSGAWFGAEIPDEVPEAPRAAPVVTSVPSVSASAGTPHSAGIWVAVAVVSILLNLYLFFRTPSSSTPTSDLPRSLSHQQPLDTSEGELEAKAEALETEVADLTSDVSELRDEVDNVMSKVEELSDGYSDWEDVRDDLDLLMISLESEMSDVESEMSDVESSSSDLKREIDYLEPCSDEE